MLIDVAYVGNHAVKLVLLADLNQARPLTTAELALPAAQRPTLDQRRPIPGFRSISAVLPAAFSNYHALQIKFERRFSKGLYLLNSFTWSKAIDNVSQVLEEPNGNDGPSAEPVRHRRRPRPLSVRSAVQQHDQLRLGTAVRTRARFRRRNVAVVGRRDRRMVFDRHQHDAERPDDQLALPAVAGDGQSAIVPGRRGAASERQRRRCWPRVVSARLTITSTDDNITIPTVDQPFGNAGRNIARSNSFFQFDFGLQKNFRLPLNEVSKVEFRMEAFNLFNKTNFGAANSDRSSSAFGTIRSTFLARQVQLALKLSF